MGSRGCGVRAGPFEGTADHLILEVHDSNVIGWK